MARNSPPPLPPRTYSISTDDSSINATTPTPPSTAGRPPLNPGLVAERYNKPLPELPGGSSADPPPLPTSDERRPYNTAYGKPLPPLPQDAPVVSQKLDYRTAALAPEPEFEPAVSTVFFHTVTSNINSFFADSGSIFSKLTNDKRNTNATLALVGNGVEQPDLPKVNIYAHTRYKNCPTLVFDDNVMMFGFWAGNIDSYAYNFNLKPDLEYPQRVDDMDRWQKSAGVPITYRVKYTATTATLHNEEIQQRINAKDPDRALDYTDSYGRPIIDQKHKFVSRKYNLDEIPQGELRHNESHIRARLTNIKAVALVKIYDPQNLDDQIEILQTVTLLEEIRKRRSQAAANPEFVEEEFNFFQEKVALCQKAIESFAQKIALYEKDLANVGYSPSDYQFNADLVAALERKKIKYPNFALFDDEDHHDQAANNRVIWLRKNIEKSKLEIEGLEQEMIKAQRMTRAKIIKTLQQEVKIKLYDKDKMVLRKVREAGLDPDITIRDLVANYKINGDSSILVKMAKKQVSLDFIANFLRQIHDAQILVNNDVLRAAVTNGNVALTRFLLQTYPSKVNVKDDDSVLRKAIEGDHVEMYKFLIRNGAKAITSPLGNAIQSDARNVAKYLLQTRERPLYPDQFQRNFVHFKTAIENGKFEIATMFIEGKFIKTDNEIDNLFVELVKTNNLAGVKFFLKKNLIEIGAKFHVNLLTEAANLENGSSKMVKVLGDSGINSTNFKDRTRAQEILETKAAAKLPSAEDTQKLYLDAAEAAAGRTSPAPKTAIQLRQSVRLQLTPKHLRT